MPSSPRVSGTPGSATLRGALYVMRSVLTQVSGLAGILAFLSEMWNRAPLDEAVYSGVIVGGGVYLILLLVDVAVEQILVAEQRSRLREQQKDEDKEEIEVDGSSDGADSESTGSSPAHDDQDSSDPTSSGNASTSASGSSDASSEDTQLATV